MQLINSINSSVDALDGLFSELMDITKIDTGGVEPRPTDFQLDEVFRKIRLHFEPIAFEKGLVLTVRGGHRHAYADPVLVERIVRNLTSNALALHHRRRRAGVRAHARQPAAAAGLGHRHRHQGADRERVFDEFVQVHDSASAPRPAPAQGSRPRPGDRAAACRR